MFPTLTVKHESHKKIKRYHKLQKLQNRAARVITTSSYDMNANHPLNSLRQDNLAKRREKLNAILMFKMLNDLVADYPQDLF